MLDRKLNSRCNLLTSERSPDETARNSRKRIWRVLVAVCLLACVLFHPLLLTALARCLVVDEASAGATYAVVLGGDSRFDVASQMLKDTTPQGVLVFEGRRTALVACGVLPPAHEIARRELETRGVLKDQVTVLNRKTYDMWGSAECLGNWLQQNNADVVLLTDRLGSRRVRYIVDQVLSDQLADRVFVHALVDRRYDETDWWKTRRGFKSLFYSSLSLIYASLVGRPRHEDTYQFDPDVFEDRLRGMLSSG